MEKQDHIYNIYVRTKSVLEKAGYIPEFSHIDINKIQNKESQKIIKILYQFNNILNQVIEKNETSFLARFLIELAQSYSNFYNENKILGEDKEIQDARIYLTYAVGNVLKIGAGLLGIKMPNKM